MNATPAPAPVSASASDIRVMVVDDSVVVRGLISRRLEAEPGVSIVASASNGEMALLELRRKAIDVIILDIEMPVMDGLTALPQLLAIQPGVKIIIASTLSRRNGEISLKALQLGAADYLPKPDGSALLKAEDFHRELIDKVRALGARRAAPGRLAPRPAPAVPPPVFTPRTAAPPEVIAIGGSTGAPPVLTRIFEGLRGRVRQPIFVTQHMPAVFTSILAEQLTRIGGRPCAEGQDGEPVVEGHAYVAPGGYHMTVAREAGRPVIRLNQGPQENFCRPAVDPMLRSLAEVYGSRVVAFILTGMGLDGAKGCEALARAGGRFFVQDEASSVVWGMPGAAAKTGLCSGALPLDRIAAHIITTSGAMA